MNRRSVYRLVEVDYDKMHCVLHAELKWNDQVLAIWSASIWAKILSNAGFTKAFFPESTNIPFEQLLHWHAQFIVHGRCYYKMDDVGWYSIWSAPVNRYFTRQHLAWQSRTVPLRTHPFNSLQERVSSTFATAYRPCITWHPLHWRKRRSNGLDNWPAACNAS